MKLKSLSSAMAFVTAVHASAAQPVPPLALSPSPEQAQTVQLVTEILKRFPYRPIQFDVPTSEQIMERYLRALDPQKLIFLQADIDGMRETSRTLATELERGDLHLPYDVFGLYRQRVDERLVHARALLSNGFDFTEEESTRLDRSQASYARTDAELDDLWRKRVKNDWLLLRLTGKEDDTIRAMMDKRFASLQTRGLKQTSHDVFHVFMDAISATVDPHTEYFGSAKSESLDTTVKLASFGIGVALYEKDEYTVIRELVPGGPAARSTQLQVGDRIVGIGQGEYGTILNVVGMPVDEVVALIRGKKDSTVRLDVLPAGAGRPDKRKLITLIRSKVSLIQQARKLVIPVLHGGVTRRVAIIFVPTFYQDFDARRDGDTEFKSVTRDVIGLIKALRDERVDAVLIDLRNNGGGALEEAVALTGLFIGSGPVLQERNAEGCVFRRT